MCLVELRYVASTNIFYALSTPFHPLLLPLLMTAACCCCCCCCGTKKHFFQFVFQGHNQYFYVRNNCCPTPHQLCVCIEFSVCFTSPVSFCVGTRTASPSLPSSGFCCELRWLKRLFLSISSVFARALSFPIRYLLLCKFILVSNRKELLRSDAWWRWWWYEVCGLGRRPCTYQSCAKRAKMKQSQKVRKMCLFYFHFYTEKIYRHLAAIHPPAPKHTRWQQWNTQMCTQFAFAAHTHDREWQIKRKWDDDGDGDVCSSADGEKLLQSEIHKWCVNDLQQ